MNWFWQIYYLIRTELIEISLIDPKDVVFNAVSTPAYVGLFLIVIFLFALFVRRRKSYRAGSGFVGGSRGEGFGRQLIRLTPAALFALSLAATLFALTNPYINGTEMRSIIETREVIYLLDTSTSMNTSLGSNWKLQEDKTYSREGAVIALFARENLMRFLELRRGQGDRSCLWIFSSHPYKIQDCVEDDDVFMFQVYSAPHILSGGELYTQEGLRVVIIQGEGETDLAEALRAVANYLDEEGNLSIENRALIIVTDAEIESRVNKELRELKNRRVTPYVLIISQSNWLGGKADEFIRDVRRIGGEFYHVRKPGSLEAAFEDINALEQVEIEISEQVMRHLLFQKALLISALFLVTAFISAVIVEVAIGKIP